MNKENGQYISIDIDMGGGRVIPIIDLAFDDEGSFVDMVNDLSKIAETEEGSYLGNLLDGAGYIAMHYLATEKQIFFFDRVFSDLVAEALRENGFVAYSHGCIGFGINGTRGEGYVMPLYNEIGCMVVEVEERNRFEEGVLGGFFDGSGVKVFS